MPSSGTNLFTCNSEFGEPSTGGAGKTAWWKWTAPTNGYCTVDTLLSSNTAETTRDTIIAVYPSVNINQAGRIAFNDNHLSTSFTGSPNLSSVTFYAAAGQQYHFQVDAHNYALTSTAAHVNLRVRLLELRSTTRRAVWSIPSNESLIGGITVTMTSKGSVSGKLAMPGKTYSFKGVVGGNGQFITTINRKTSAGSLPLIPISLWIDLTGIGNFQIQISEEGNYYSKFLPDKIFSTTDPNVVAGYHTISLIMPSYSATGFYTTTISKVAVSPVPSPPLMA